MSNKRRLPGRSATCEPIKRGRAVRQLAGHLADRTAFVISASPDTLAAAARSLSALPGCRCYADNGTDLVFVLGGLAVAIADLMNELLPCAVAAVFTVPKTVPARRLAEALHIPDSLAEDGSQDLLVLHRGADRVEWPVLLVEALALVDPEMAMQLAANDLRNLS